MDIQHDVTDADRQPDAADAAARKRQEQEDAETLRVRGPQRPADQMQAAVMPAPVPPSPPRPAPTPPAPTPSAPTPPAPPPTPKSEAVHAGEPVGPVRVRPDEKA